MQETLNLGRSQQVPSVLTLQRQFAWGLLQTLLLRILFFVVISFFSQKKRQQCELVYFLLFSVTHQHHLCIPALHFPVIFLNLPGIWESLPACESCTLTHSCNLGGSCIFESDGFICFSKFLLNHLLVYKWHSKQQINESAFLLCTSCITSETSPHAHQFQLSDWYTWTSRMKYAFIHVFVAINWKGAFILEEESCSSALSCTAPSTVELDPGQNPALSLPAISVQGTTRGEFWKIYIGKKKKNNKPRQSHDVTSDAQLGDSWPRSRLWDPCGAKVKQRAEFVWP